MVKQFGTNKTFYHKINQMYDKFCMFKKKRKSNMANIIGHILTKGTFNAEHFINKLTLLSQKELQL